MLSALDTVLALVLQYHVQWGCISFLGFEGAFLACCFCCIHMFTRKLMALIIRTVTDSKILLQLPYSEGLSLADVFGHMEQNRLNTSIAFNRCSAFLFVSFSWLVLAHELLFLPETN